MNYVSEVQNSCLFYNCLIGNPSSHLHLGFKGRSDPETDLESQEDFKRQKYKGRGSTKSRLGGGEVIRCSENKQQSCFTGNEIITRKAANVRFK